MPGSDAQPIGIKHIGIMACSAEGASLCYRTICAEAPALLGPHAHPEITMHTPPLDAYVACLDAGDLAGVGALMLNSANKLKAAGADFLICPDNTVHQAIPHIVSGTSQTFPLPFLHIAGVVAEAAASAGYRTLGLTGTRWLVDSDVYPTALGAHGIDWIRPSDAERSEIDRLIMDELVKGIFTPAAVAYFQQVIERLKDGGCDAIILGCTEIPLIMNDENSPLPTLDSTRLLARAALNYAIANANV